ncbi:amino acid permease [Vagococcus intermedius]|uniref:Amino acid permease n=1 Tax=Vagococcus intermedius TaxID=2991418 RepID=A0AAF0CVG2_9ENTE|nr:amino acid permease [Vagococcus intermedius]WEG73628.1 amino acid permease [Vagococcus intermedius]WEG75712.1 amino acid permease [Vagococcus intermedius]
MSLERGLSNRHVQLISIGGAIGTGLFLASGKSIELAGPSILLVYLIVGAFIFLIMRGLGELLLSNLECHSFVDLAHEYLGRRTAFITGWTYWFCWISVAMSDLTAVGIYMRFWFPNLPQWIPALIVLLFLMFMNLASVKLFGEIEFWLALIKIIAIVALIGIGGFMILTNYETETGTASLKNIYSHGGFFPNGFSGFILAFQLAVFSFTGVELVGLTAGETKNPKKVIPQAINNIPIRILLFYIGSLGVIMSIQPWNTIDPKTSPFVTVFSTIGIIGAASIINFVVLSSAASACNSALFSTSRMLYGLSINDHAPEKFSKLTKRKNPSLALYFSTLVVGITVLLNYIMPDGVFSLISGISTVCFLYIWAIIVICHLKYVQQAKKRGAFTMPWAPYSNYLCLAFLLLIIVILAILPDMRISLVITPIWFIALYIIYNKKFATV